MNIDIVAVSGEIRKYLKSVGVNHIAKASSVEEVKAKLANSSDSISDLIKNTLKTAFGDEVTAEVEVGDDVVIKVECKGKQATTHLSSLVGRGYLSDLFVNLVTEVHEKVYA